jgi:hypothetical protein
MEILIVLVVIGLLVWAITKEDKPPKEKKPGEKLEDAVKAVKKIWDEN